MINFTGWKYYQADGVNEGIQSPDGLQSLGLNDKDVQDWLTAGNTPDPADIPPAPTYVELRVLAYAPISDQLDMIYKDKLNNTTTWQDHITAVKIANPKV